MLNVLFGEYDDFISYIDDFNPRGERFYTVRENDDGYTLIAVVQSSRRRLVLKCFIRKQELDKVNLDLQDRDFYYVKEIKF